MTNYLVLVHVHRPQVGVEEQLVRLDVDGALAPAFAAQGPLRIDETPKRRTCEQKA